MRGWTLLVVLALATVALAGCAGDDGGDDTTPTPTASSSPTPSTSVTPSATPTPSPTPEPKRDPVTWTVEVRDSSFSPKTLEIQVGDTVEWVRVGSAPHTVTADDGSFDSGDCPGPDCFMAVGRQSFSVTFDAVGEAPYFCEVHGGPGGAGMSGVVTVLDRLDAAP